MLYTVEVRLIGGDLPTSMSQMRTWLDHMHLEPDGFRCSRGTPATTMRLDFRSEPDAISFAKAFAGRVLGSLEHMHSDPGLRGRLAGSEAA